MDCHIKLSNLGGCIFGFVDKRLVFHLAGRVEHFYFERKTGTLSHVFGKRRDSCSVLTLFLSWLFQPPKQNPFYALYFFNVSIYGMDTT